MKEPVALLVVSCLAAVVYFAWRDHQRSSDERIGCPDDGHVSVEWLADLRLGNKDHLKVGVAPRRDHAIPFDRGAYTKAVGF